VTEQSEHILREALELPQSERAEVAVELIASLDGETDPDAASAWAEEVEQRARRALAGQNNAEDWPDVRQRIDQRLREQ
jgi:broad specificity phosphatase PhoE